MSTWMVVEDEPDIYELLLAMFEMWGIDGVAFVDGEEAITWIEEADKDAPPDLPELALLDIRLPGSISGPMVGERIRKSPRLKNIAIVLITAYKLTDDEKSAVIKQAGADMLLSKPLPSQAQFKKLLEETVAARQTKAPKVPAKAAIVKKATTVKSPKKVK